MIYRNNILYESSRNTAITIQWNPSVRNERDKLKSKISSEHELASYVAMLSYLKWMSKGNYVNYNDGNPGMNKIEVKLLDEKTKIYEIKTPPYRTYFRLATITSKGKNPFKVCYIVRFLRKDSQKARKADIDGAINTWKTWRDDMKKLGKKVETTNKPFENEQKSVNQIINSDPNFIEKHLNNCYKILSHTGDIASIEAYFKNVIDNINHKNSV